MYEKLYTIFGASIANDTLDHMSTQSPLDSDDECALDAEMRHWGPVPGKQHGLPIDFDDDMDFFMGFETPPFIALGQSQCRQQRVRPSMQVDADMSNCLNELARTEKARRKYYEERGEGTSNKRNKGTTSSNHDAHRNQHTQSVQLLQALDPPLPDDVFLRAFDKLLDIHVQTGFLALYDQHKRLWAMNCI
ncbi:uncharacterized protein LOC122313429 isoform X2 [Carya illinoinensis]|uniref:uncharacterized protein LOC122313429 isoform X2 n=2 Tax=Carya illinoinensis TaxID=32201 RepID=UPI001C72623A|nr:uncharacterized protein LOC122313429 isoform X2 [Carya illinoinensis]XP_042984379.1 uncharacterized protein LOC122313429 isoform X2 [Carya illinoinensis]XP_042984389.1 uncharacterized protein LOC122313429 isoform X2 [Carya illinoinensis]XP_042984396.1 uncharacterized protein LOC122313429 isoform X2 [Carya illinoinensis]